MGRLKKREPVVVVRNKRKRYTTAYKDYLDIRGKHPRVWAFHNYGDWEAYSLRAKCRACAHITKRFYRLFRSDDYRYPHAGELRRPRIWLTEAGVPYHLSCNEGLTDGFRAKYCPGQEEGDPDKLLLTGLVNQRGTIAYMLRKLAKDFPGISRLYYLRLRNRLGDDYPDLSRNSGTCRRTPRTAPPGWCPLNDFGLIGSDDDAAKTYGFTLPGASGQSGPGQPRLAFCIVRDRNTRLGRLRINNPRRLRTCG